MDDGYVESAVDRLRFVMGVGDKPVRMRTWALYAVVSAMASHDEETWHAVERATEANRDDATDDAVFGVMLVHMYSKAHRQYDPFLKAARQLAATMPHGVSTRERIAQFVFLSVMADATRHQLECSIRYKKRADACWPADDEKPESSSPEWFVMAHLHRPRRSRSDWRRLCTDGLLARSQQTPMARFAYVYCALVLAQDHHLIDRLSTHHFRSTDDACSEAEVHVWGALEEILLRTRSSDVNPFAVPASVYNNMATSDGCPRLRCPGTGWPVVVLCLCAVLVVVVVVCVCLKKSK